eukprot:g5444.t1
MALRNLVTSADGCAPSDSSVTNRRTNPLSHLTDALFRRQAANQRRDEAGPSSSNLGSFFDEVQNESTPQLQELSTTHHQLNDVLNQSVETGLSSQAFNFADRDAVLSQTFKSFLESARNGVPFLSTPLTSVEFDPLEQQKIRNRVQNLCQHIFADQGSQFAQMQASRFLECIQIDTIPSGRGFIQHNTHQRWSPYPTWSPQAGVDWVQEFNKMSVGFGLDQNRVQSEAIPEQQSMEQDFTKEETDNISSALIEQMSKDPDPKFRNSKFLQFVKMLNSGELVIEGDQVETKTTTNSNPTTSQVNPVMFDGSVNWGMDAGGLEGGWLEDHEIEEWINRYSQLADGPHYEHKDYQFASSNVYLDNRHPLEVSKDLLDKGDLVQATLAAEAEVQKNKNSIEGWIQLGRIHAENNNDLKAISAFEEARLLDPSNLEVLMELGVCHANELHEQQAVEALLTWLKHRSNVSTEPVDSSQSLSHALKSFHEALVHHPNEVETKVALGVLHHLGRDFDEAIGLFQEALQSQSMDYSLWNKLGATQANAARSVEAIESYKKALELRPSYMRARANLGISCANVGDYQSSVEHYIHALIANPEAEFIWQYLKSSIICAGFPELFEAIEKRDLGRLRGLFSI